MYRTLLLLIASFVFFTGCKKDKPPAGSYWMYIRYSTGQEASGPVTISESSKDKIIIENSELRKDGKNISGTIYSLSFSNGSFTIDGECSHKLFSNNFKIEGTFRKTAYYLGGPHNHFFGTFKIVTEP